MNRTTLGFLFCGLLFGCSDSPAPSPQSANTNTTHAAAPLYPENAISKPVTNTAKAAPTIEQSSTPTKTLAKTTAKPQSVSRVAAVVSKAPEPAAPAEPDAANPSEPSADLIAKANAGDPVAQRELGKIYGEQWNLEESNKWYRKAAEQGDVRAQHMMGVRYTFGQGVEADTAEASRWFMMAAEQGDADAQYSIGLRWLRGEAGEPRDFAEAAKWFQLAADQGLGTAQLSLGRRYANGEGVNQDYIEAYKWLWLAQQSKTAEAGVVLKDVAAKMTPEQINLAKEMAKGFTPKPPTPIQR